MRLIFMPIGLFFIACGEKHETPPEVDLYCEVAIPADDSRPDVLIIGDSISIGYTPYVQRALPDVDVQRNPCNARGSENGRLNIDRWLNRRSNWDAITFNHGIWDTVHAYGVTDEEYRANITEIATKIKARTNRPIFVTTTRIPPNNTLCEVGRENRLNAIALEVMSTLSIPVIDLNTLSHEIKHLYFSYAFDADVHLTPQGYEELSRPIVQGITDALN